jgi:hypothetical protein
MSVYIKPGGIREAPVTEALGEYPVSAQNALQRWDHARHAERGSLASVRLGSSGIRKQVFLGISIVILTTYRPLTILPRHTQMPEPEQRHHSTAGFSASNSARFQPAEAHRC